MSGSGRRAVALVLGLAVSAAWSAQVQAALTAAQSVELALKNSSQMIGADASVLNAKSSLYGASAGILPSLSASVARSNAVTENQKRFFGVFSSQTDEAESHGTTPGIGVSWTLLDLSSLTNYRAAGAGLRAAQFSRTATRNDVALATLRQYYLTVGSYHLAGVASGALRVARDNERRVRALFEVGSVSKSDLLKAQVRTAQSELDSLTARQAIVNQRIALATQIGIPESQLGDIDTVLTAPTTEYEESALFEEAKANRPDLKAAEADLRSARSARLSARLQRLPSLNFRGDATFEETGRQTITNANVASGQEFSTDRSRSWTVSLDWNVFDGLRTDAANAAAEAQLRLAKDRYDVLNRNLGSEVHQAVLLHREAVEKDRVAARALESAIENLKLTQQKYNVGSATILELVDAQVQATQAEANVVTARAAIRIAEAQIERVRGR